MSLLEQLVGYQQKENPENFAVKAYRNAFDVWKTKIAIRDTEALKKYWAELCLRDIPLPSDIISPLLESPDHDMGIFITTAFNQSDSELLLIPYVKEIEGISGFGAGLYTGKTIVNLGNIGELGHYISGTIVNHGTMHFSAQKVDKSSAIIVNYNNLGVDEVNLIQDLRESIVIHKGKPKLEVQSTNSSIIISDTPCHVYNSTGLICIAPEVMTYHGTMNVRANYLQDGRLKEYVVDIENEFSSPQTKHLEKRFGTCYPGGIYEKMRDEIRSLLD